MHKWSIQAVDEFFDKRMNDTHILILSGPLKIGDIAYAGGLEGWDTEVLDSEGVVGLGDASACFAVARTLANKSLKPTVKQRSPSGADSPVAYLRR